MTSFNAHQRSHLIKVVTVTTALGVLITMALPQISQVVMQRLDETSGRWLAAIVGIAVTAAMAFLMQHVNQSDELYQRVQLEAMAFAFRCGLVIVAIHTFPRAAGVPAPPVGILLPCMMVVWAAALIRGVLRYR